jgi:hypothetical protein
MDHTKIVVSHTASEQRRTDALLLLAQAQAEGRSPEPCSISSGSSAGFSASSDPSADFNRSILDASVDCIKVLNLDGTLHSMNEKVQGHSQGNTEVVGCDHIPDAECQWSNHTPRVDLS